MSFGGHEWYIHNIFIFNYTQWYFHLHLLIAVYKSCGSRFQFRIYDRSDRSTYEPHLQFSHNSFEFDLRLNDFNVSFPSSRFALEMMMFSNFSEKKDNPAGIKVSQSIDDEHSPGVFQVDIRALFQYKDHLARYCIRIPLINSCDAGDGIYRVWMSIPCLLMPWLLKSPRASAGMVLAAQDRQHVSLFQS